jgi:Zn-dependent metalloprotease
MYGETDMNGPGGNAIQNWIYGLERPSLNVSRLDNSCIFDNGVVAIVDMQNTLGSEKSGLLPNQIDELAYPPYHFDCSHSTYHSERPIVENGKHWTYSTLNDALYYGTIVHDMFVHYLGEPPLNHKIWLRVHYGPRSSIRAFWDGAYANFSDAYPFQFSTASLDIIAHEIAHGVLLRLSHMSYSSPLSVDAQTISEAFSDISGVMAKHWVDPSQNIWWHGSETDGYIRKLDRIKTEASAVSSYLDYDSAGNNPYLRIGLMSYPFYLLAEKWNIETAYLVYLQAARSWTPDITLVEAANSILEAAGYLGYQTSDVVDAFEAIKLPLP